MAGGVTGLCRMPTWPAGRTGGPSAIGPTDRGSAAASNIVAAIIVCSWTWDGVEEIIAACALDAVATLCTRADTVAEDESALVCLGADRQVVAAVGPSRCDVVDALDDGAARRRHLQTALRGLWWSDDDDPGSCGGSPGSAPGVRASSAAGSLRTIPRTTTDLRHRSSPSPCAGPVPVVPPG